MSDNASNQLSKFGTKNWVEINDEYRSVYSVNSQIKFKTTMLRSNLGDYADLYIFVKGKMRVANGSAAGAVANNTNKKVIFKDCTPFTNCMN